MNKLPLSILALLLFIICKQEIQAQETSTTGKFNLNFEQNNTGDKLPDNWFKWGTFEIDKDTIAYTGKFAGKVESKEETESFGCIAYMIPANYDGKIIRLEGYMKTENVVGYSGLLLRIDGNGKRLAFDNMYKQKIEGTNDWKKYSITLPYPEDAELIFVAGIVGKKGTAWFDDFVVTIDGKDIQTLKERKPKVFKAQVDTVFNKGSNIKFPVLNKEYTTNLEVLGKVWGFLKYHHPEIGNGNYNWDSELFRVLPQYLKVKNASERDQVLINWIEKLGKVDLCTSCDATKEDAFLKPDMAWIDAAGLNTTLKEKLAYIYKNRFQGKHYYVKRARNIGNPDFTNEQAYVEMDYPDAGFRLLALYRYWNMIHYYFPYKQLSDKDWNTTLKEYIPMFVDAKSELDYELAMVQIIGDVQDTHAGLWGNDDKIEAMFGENQAPFEAKFIENKLVVTKYYNPEYEEVSKLKIGDIITNIDGKTVATLKKDLYKYHTASNETVKDRDIASTILRSPKTEISIAYISDGKKETHNLTLYKRKSLKLYGVDTTEKCYKMLAGNIGYVTLENIQNEDIPEIKKMFKKTKGIIIDIRNYPSTFVPFKLGGFFVSKPTPFVKFTEMNAQNPGEFNFMVGPDIPNDTETYAGKLVVLVNEQSQSQSEYTAMAFRAGDNTTIVGSTTAGADGNVSYIYLPGGLRTAISGLGVYYPNGGETQRIGIVPDVEVKPTVKGIQQGKDEVLEKAIEIILKK